QTGMLGPVNVMPHVTVDPSDINPVTADVELTGTPWIGRFGMGLPSPSTTCTFTVSGPVGRFTLSVLSVLPMVIGALPCSTPDTTVIVPTVPGFGCST